VDDADTRRGRLTANALWGNHVSVLVGDYLFSQVLSHLVDGVPRSIASVLAGAIADMALGVLRETELTGHFDTTEAQYFEVIRHKTASLMSAACVAGALTTGAGDDVVAALAHFGIHLGMAYQIIDDVLDFAGDPSRLGKPVGNDLRERKVTLPLIKALAVAGRHERQEMRELFECIRTDPQAVPRLTRHVRRQGGCEMSRASALDHVTRAREHLHQLPLGPARTALGDLAGFIVQRDR